MKRIRLSEQELKNLVEDSVMTVIDNKLNEGVDWEQEIKFAQKALMKIPVGEIGMRLDGTKFYGLYEKMRDAAVNLNNALVKHIRKEK